VGGGAGGREPGKIGGGGRERKRAESGNSKKAGIINQVLKYFQKQESKMSFDLQLAYFET